MIEQLKYEDFDEIFEIMENSFPKDEYRTYAGQKELLQNPVYRIYGLRESEKGKLLGFAAVWMLEEAAFIEHLAVASNLRNGGLGSRILSELRHVLKRRMCLEVELPDTELAARRIGFYERNGFFLNRYPYMQPALAKGQNAVPLMIMTTESAVSEAEFLKIKELLYRKVYHVI